VKVSVEVDPARLRPADVPYLVGDPTRALAECGWQTKLTLAQTLTDVLEGWRAEA
jgi:GDP-4-dehydro-6-deoxy-D-mannose reductase